MPRLYVPPSQLGAARGGPALSGPAARYLTAVLRLGPGAAVEVFDGQGGTYAAVLSADAAALELGEKRIAPAGAADVTLVQALAKGDKLDVMVQKATKLGVRRIVPLAAERSVVKLAAERGAARADRWRRIAQEASRQCGRADVPLVDEPRNWEQLF